MLGDESYAGSRNFYHLEETVQSLTGYTYVIPTHQGRGAEQIIIPHLVKNRGQYVLGNMHFDTTKAHIELAGARAVNFITPEALDTTTEHPFKGNFDLGAMEQFIQEHGAQSIVAIVTTVTCNSVGGQPVSMANIKAAYALGQKYNIPRLSTVPGLLKTLTLSSRGKRAMPRKPSPKSSGKCSPMATPLP